MARPATYTGPFAVRVKPLLERAMVNFNKDNVFPRESISDPWSFPRPDIDWSLTQFKKSETAPEVFLSKFYEIKSSYVGFREIYTDGSKSSDAVGFAAFYPALKFHLNGRLNPLSSVFSAELYAILQSFYMIKNDPRDKFIIYSDSKSSLQALSQYDPINPIICTVLKLYFQLLNLHKIIKFCWIPSHCGIPGNERVDALAKEALTARSVNLQVHKVVATDYNMCIRERQNLNHQVEFEFVSQYNKLYQIQPYINYNTNLGLYSRKEEMVITRLKIGHTYYTSAYLLRGEPPPHCDLCDCTITVKHILFECVEYEVQRRRFLNIPVYCDMFKKENYPKLIKFIKSIGLYSFI